MARYCIAQLTCGHCKATIGQTVRAQDPAARLIFDMAAREVRSDTAAKRPALLAALADDGYPTPPL